jgi:DNA-binding HxlR family transcriptional regulator
MKLSDKFSQTKKCPVRHILDRFGDKWSVLVILNLGETKVMRFNQINRSIGDISQKMLTATLRNLEADGLVSRKIYAEVPPRVEYGLTPLGESLLPLIKNLTDWALKNFSHISNNRKKFGNKPSK